MKYLVIQVTAPSEIDCFSNYSHRQLFVNVSGHPAWTFYMEKRMLFNFELPSRDGLVHVLPISGGADSSCLALLMHERFPEISFRMFFSDTGAEPVSTYEFLDLIEQVTGRPIERIKPELDLFQLVDRFNGFLPSSQARWCTRELKLKSFQKWMKQFDGQPMAMYVGVRRDEPGRVAFTIDGVETVMPFVDAGWGRSEVFGYLSSSVGVPRTYQTRTRSGCTVCPFQRRSEVVGLLQYQPIEFVRGMKYEKLNGNDVARHQEGVPIWKDATIGANWLSMPMPKEGEVISGSRPKKDGLFQTTGIFVAGEFFMADDMGVGSFVWHQRLISFSPTLGGIKRQVDDRFRHLLHASEAYELTPDEIRRNAKFAVWYLELPADVLDVTGPIGKSYTWQQGQSYAQVRHITQWATRVLNAEQLRLQSEAVVKSEMSIEYEWRESARQVILELQGSPNPVGQVVSGQWYEPTEKEPELTEEEELSLLPCPMCHI